LTAGIPAENIPIYKRNTISGDNKIGVENAAFILEKMSGMR